MCTSFRGFLLLFVGVVESDTHANKTWSVLFVIVKSSLMVNQSINQSTSQQRRLTMDDALRTYIWCLCLGLIDILHWRSHPVDRTKLSEVLELVAQCREWVFDRFYLSTIVTDEPDCNVAVTLPGLAIDWSVPLRWRLTFVRATQWWMNDCFSWCALYIRLFGVNHFNTVTRDIVDHGRTLEIVISMMIMWTKIERELNFSCCMLIN